MMTTEQTKYLAYAFDSLYIFDADSVAKYVQGSFSMRYSFNSLFCGCSFEGKCKHQKMFEGSYILRGEKEDTVKGAVEAVLHIFGIEPQAGARYPSCGSIELKVNSGSLIVGVKRQLVVYIK